MTENSLSPLIRGYKQFHQEYGSKAYDEYRQEATMGQSPKVMIISCSDSRVNPLAVTRSRLGDIFLVSNVANIIPPFRPDNAHHSTSSALEFAVGTLGVEHIIVMGHSGCGGIRALLDGAPVAIDDKGSFIKPWVDIIASAKTKVQSLPASERYHACEREALKISLANLSTFPWITERVVQGKLSLRAWYFDIPTGVISAYDSPTDSFAPLA